MPRTTQSPSWKLIGILPGASSASENIRPSTASLPCWSSLPLFPLSGKRAKVLSPVGIERQSGHMDIAPRRLWANPLPSSFLQIDRMNLPGSWSRLHEENGSISMKRQGEERMGPSCQSLSPYLLFTIARARSSVPPTSHTTSLNASASKHKSIFSQRSVKCCPPLSTTRKRLPISPVLSCRSLRIGLL